MVTRLAPPKMQSLMMGLWFGSMAVSNLLAGFLAAFSSRMDTTHHTIEFRKDALYAEVRLDGRMRRLELRLVDGEGGTPIPSNAPQIAFRGEYVTDDGAHHDVALPLLPQAGEEDEPGTAATFVASLAELPSDVDDIEDVAGSFAITVQGEPLSAELRHEHPTFILKGLPGFYLLLVILPIAAGLLLTLLTPWLKRMMHGVH
jgi:hypothetical protein